MWNTIKKTISFLCIALISISVLAQEDKKNIGTEHVVIVKAYTPTISDAFKIKATPTLNDSVTQQKKEVRYSIFSVPVASTFTPEKGRAASIDRPKKEKLYENYATLGFGNYTSVLAEFYSNFQLNRTDNIGLYLHHDSSQGGINDIVLDDKYYASFLDLNYTSRTRDYTYGIELGGEHQLYNWYGLSNDSLLTTEQIEAIGPQQNYYGLKLGGKLDFKDSPFKKAAVKYRFFGDSHSSMEHHVVATPTVAVEIADELITTDIIIDYLSGSFERDRDPVFMIPNEYGNLIMGIHPTLVVLRDNLSLHLGIAMYYSIDNKNNDNDFFIYPKVTASYRLLDESVIAYGGLEGGLKQNTYRDAVQVNPYVSPTLRLTPTNKQYEAFVGLKGKVSDVVSYNFRGSYMAENGKPLFVNNEQNTLLLQGYDYGNSFSYRYDDIKTVTGYGELNFNINKKFKLSATAEYFSYTLENQQEAWNLPDLQASVLVDYQITEQWFAGVKLFYKGERKDVDTNVFVLPPTPEATITIDPYIDVNANLGYRFNDRLSVFLKGNNLLGKNYDRWVHFPVQGVQVLGGVTYKFDF